MARKPDSALSLVFSVFALLFAINNAGAAEDFFPSFADTNTVGLLLFDETEYPYTTLTGAGLYEYDLRLMKAGRLVAGRFGNAFKVTPGLDMAVSYAGWKGAISYCCTRKPGGIPSGLCSMNPPNPCPAFLRVTAVRSRPTPPDMSSPGKAAPTWVNLRAKWSVCGSIYRTPNSTPTSSSRDNSKRRSS